VQTKTLYGVVAILLAVLIVASSFATLYYFQYTKEVSANSTYVQELDRYGVRYISDILLNFGNGTQQWNNNTVVEPGWNLYVTTQVIVHGQLNATYYPEYGSHLITAIYNVANSNTESWFLWTYNSTASWQTAQYGPDDIIVTNNSVYAWTYCGMTASFTPTCTP
jgi:hypothetical protein